MLKKIIPFVVFVFIFLIYLETMLPSQGFHDIGELQTKVASLDIAHPTGFPTYVILGKIIISFLSFGEIAWKVNFLSVIYSLLTLFFFFVFLKRLTHNSYWSLFGSLYLAFSLPFWNWAGQADTHTLGRMFLALLILLFYNLVNNTSSKKQIVFGLIFGLGLGNHLLLLYSIPGFLIWYILLLLKSKIKFSIRDLSLIFCGLLLGVLIYLFLPIREYFPSVFPSDYSLRTWSGFYRHVSGADFQGLMYQGGIAPAVMNVMVGLEKISEYFYLSGLFIGLIGIGYGLVNYNIESTSLIMMFISFLIFSTNYPTNDATRYYLSFLSIYSIFIGLGCHALYKTVLLFVRRTNSQKISNAILLGLILIILIPLVKIFAENFNKVDKHQNYSAKYYSQSIFDNVEKNAVILSWWNYSTPLWYRQYVLNERKDISILNKDQGEWRRYVDEYIYTRPVYVVEQDRSLEDFYRQIPMINIYKVVLK